MKPLETERVDCPLCGRRRTRRLYRKFDLPIVRCRDCGMVYVDPRPVERDALKRYTPNYFFGNYLPSFGADANNYDHDVVQGRFIPYVEITRHYGGPGRRLLDVGTGAGFFLRIAEDAGWRAEGIEISDAAAAYATDIVKVAVHRGKFGEFPLPPETYDLVTLFDFLEHVPDPVATLEEVRRVLKPGGIALVQTPDFDGFGRRVLGKRWAVLTPEEHLVYFTRGTLAAAAEKAGFEVLGIRNLWSFDSRCAHGARSPRARAWKALATRLERAALSKRIHRANYLDLLAAANGETAEWPSSPVTARIFGAVYKCSQKLCHGDPLIAIIKKKAQAEA